MVIASVMDLLNQWNSIGMDYILAFLLIFAVVYGVLTATNILGKNKGVHIVIALVIGLMSLKYGTTVNFFSSLFPRTAVAISVILVLVILTSVFVPKEHWGGWSIGLYSVGAIAFIFVIFNTFADNGGYSFGWWDQWGGMIIGALLIIGVIIAIAVSSGDGKKPDKTSGHNTITFGPRYE